MEEKLVDLLNEMLEDSKPSWRKLLGNLLFGPDSYLVRDVNLPEDLIVSDVEDGMVRVSMLGILNTALKRSGSTDRLIATVDDDGFLQKVELGPYRVKKVEAKPECDHHWMEWRGHHDHENEGRLRCTRCSVFKGDL